MPRERKYQLIAMGPAADQFWVELKAEFTNQITDIGLDPDKDAELLRSSAMRLNDVLWDSAPVAIWFGSLNSQASQRDIDLLEDFQIRMPNPVFPVCETLDRYSDQVPESLRPINGQAWEESSVVANVLKAFSLTREERQIFISYRRNESEAVAQQLYDALQHRKFRVFLDTASVEAGVSFQDVLCGRLSDVDLVLFLDTPNARDSNWVYKELLQAEQQGMGILQVLWPGRKQDEATSFCDDLPLDRLNFVSWSPQYDYDQADPGDILKPDTIQKIVREVERTRIRSIRTRRDQVLTEIIDACKEETCQAFSNPTGNSAIPFSHIEFRDGNNHIGYAFPVVGFPDSITLQKRHESLDPANTSSACVLYDELGMITDFKDHLRWLNESLEIQTVSVSAIGQWLKRIYP